MTRLYVRLWILWVLGCTIGTPLAVLRAQAPNHISYAGTLTDPQGEPREGPLNLTFRIFGAPVGGTPLHAQTIPNVMVRKGQFAVLLGPFTDPVFAQGGGERFIEVQVGGEAPLVPRPQLSSVPYAQRTGSVDGAQGGAIQGGLSVSGSVGIGTGGPGASLHVENPITYNNHITNLLLRKTSATTAGNVGAGITFQIQNELGQFGSYNTAGIYNLYDANGNRHALALKATASGASPMNTIAYFRGDGNVGIGTITPTARLHVMGSTANTVYAESPVASTVIYGRAAATSGEAIGVRGDTSSPNGWGVHGVNSATSGGEGILGTSYSPNGIGVRGHNFGLTGTPIGIYGSAYGNGYAGYFSNRVQVTGMLSKGGGSFKIDHPLDPANKYLNHSFVESPDMMNVYNGNVVLDAGGEAWVQLPDWFEALNRDFRYQLTCIGGFAPVYIAQKVSGNRFKIAGGQLGLEVSWQVTGIRQDPFAEKHRIRVEEEKLAAEKGFYLHPDVYGQPETKSVEWGRHPEMMQRLAEQKKQLK